MLVGAWIVNNTGIARLMRAQLGNQAAQVLRAHHRQQARFANLPNLYRNVIPTQPNVVCGRFITIAAHAGAPSRPIRPFGR
jgi:hypothetical protein